MTGTRGEPQTLIAEFVGGPFAGQRREMEYRQTEWAPADERGRYVKSGDRTGDHARRVEITSDHKAALWFWKEDPK